MKKAVIIIAIVAAVGGIGYYLYKRKKGTGASDTGGSSNVADQLKDLVAGKDSKQPVNISENLQPGSSLPAINTGGVVPGKDANIEQATPTPPDLSKPESFRGAIFYEHPYEGYTNPYQERDHGWAVKLAPGMYPSGIILKQFGIVNDQVSGVSLDPGIKVIMYADANFKGKKVETDKNIAFLKDVGFDNVMSSVEVIDTNA